MEKHLIGLLLGTEEDWPAAFETLLRRMGPVTDAGHEHHVDVERTQPFDLRYKPGMSWSSTGWRIGTTTRANG